MGGRPVLSAVALAAVASACAPKLSTRPAGPGSPNPPAATTAWAAATAACAGVQSDAPTIDLAGGRVNGDRLPPLHVLAGLTTRGEIRLVADINGRHFFTLAGTPDRALLDVTTPDGEKEYVIARADDIIEVLTGIRVGPATLLPLLTGCAGASAAVADASQRGRFIVIRAGEVTAYLESRDGQWRTAMADLPGVQVDYRAWSGSWPSEVVLAALPSGTATVRLRVREHLINSPGLKPEAFAVTPPAGATEITLTQLRQRLGRQ